MTRLPFIAVLAGLAALAPPAGAQTILVNEPERTYNVEVVGSDASARTLTIRSDAGMATMLVDASALRGLQGLQPGNRITITVRNASTGQQEAITAIVNGSLRSQPEAGSVVQPGSVTRPTGFVKTTTTVRRTVGSPVEVRSVDASARTIVVRNGDRDQVFVIDQAAGVDFDELAPGQRVLLSWRFNRDGKPEAIIRVTPAEAVETRIAAVKTNTATVTRTQTVRVAGPVEVIETDPAARTLTISDGDESRTVLVDELALVGLPDLRPGDKVLLSWGGDRVIVITKQ